MFRIETYIKKDKGCKTVTGEKNTLREHSFNALCSPGPRPAKKPGKLPMNSKGAWISYAPNITDEIFKKNEKILAFMEKISCHH